MKKSIKKIVERLMEWGENYLAILLIFCVVVFSFFMLFYIIDRKNYNDFELDIKYENLKYQSLETGKKIGRNAMMLYLLKTKQVDSLRIEIVDLLAIEDSLYEKNINK